MVRRSPVLSSRRVLIGSIIFGLFVAFDIALFVWLVYDSLSQREIEKALLEVREEAEPLAQALAERARSLGQEDLWVVVSVAQETQTYIDQVLSEREVVNKIEIRDHEGTVVWEESKSSTRGPDGVLSIETGGGDIQELPRTPRLPLQQEVAIGDLGKLVIGLSEEELQKRIGDLRGDLIRRVSVIGGLTLVLLAVAFVAVWVLFRRGRRLEDQAMEAERLAYIGTLASGLAHEIRNPLNSLQLNMQMLEEDFAEQQARGPQSRLLSITRSEISRLERLVTDFLSYAKPRPPELEAVSVRELFERVLEVLAAEIQARGVTIETSDRSAGARVEVDRGQFVQLLLNLTQNALAAMEEIEQPGVLRLSAWRREDHLEIEVSDNGCGIATEDRERIFDLFYSTRKGGTGLGLAIVERIAQTHHAEISIDSSPGRGTRIRLSMPIARETQTSQASIGAPAGGRQPVRL